MARETRVQRIVRAFENHPVFAWVLVVGGAVLAVGAVAAALTDLLTFFDRVVDHEDDRGEGHVLASGTLDKMRMEPVPRQPAYGYHYYFTGEEFAALKSAAEHHYPRQGLEFDTANIRSSNLELLQDGDELGRGEAKFTHASHAAIEEEGQGRYSFWLDDLGNRYLYFSARNRDVDPRDGGPVFQVRVRGAAQASVTLEPDRVVKVYDRYATVFSYAYMDRALKRLGEPDDPKAPFASKLVLWEDCRALGPAHSPERAIAYLGKGRYRFVMKHGRPTLLFSSSDGSDPAENGRVYWAADGQALSPGAAREDCEALMRGRGADERIVLESDRMRHYEPTLGTNAWHYVDNAIRQVPASTNLKEPESQLALYEDDKPLAFPNASVQCIKEQGNGRYLHRNDGGFVSLYFSTTNRSDPRYNSAVYRWEYRDERIGKPRAETQGSEQCNPMK